MKTTVESIAPVPVASVRKITVELTEQEAKDIAHALCAIDLPDVAGRFDAQHGTKLVTAKGVRETLTKFRSQLTENDQNMWWL